MKWSKHLCMHRPLNKKEQRGQGLFEGSVGCLSCTLIFLTSGAEIPTPNVLVFSCEFSLVFQWFTKWSPHRVHDGNETGSPAKNKETDEQGCATRTESKKIMTVHVGCR